MQSKNDLVNAQIKHYRPATQGEILAALNFPEYISLWTRLADWVKDNYPGATSMDVEIGSEYNDQGYDLDVREMKLYFSDKEPVTIEAYYYNEVTGEELEPIPYDIIQDMPFQVLNMPMDQEWQKWFSFPLVGKMPIQKLTLYVLE